MIKQNNLITPIISQEDNVGDKEKKDMEKNGSFSIAPEDRSIAEAAKKNGSSMRQISEALVERKRILANKEARGETTDTQAAPDIAWEDYLGAAESAAGMTLNENQQQELKAQYDENVLQGPEMPALEDQSSSYDPFGGRSKQEVIKLAYSKGIRTVTALKQIEDVYDMVSGLDSGAGDFTTTEQKKLEQANLLQATRKEQLDYLYKPANTDEEDMQLLIDSLSGS